MEVFAPDYFEESIQLSGEEYTMIIGDGKVHAEVDSTIYDATPDMSQRLDDGLCGRFLADC